MEFLESWEGMVSSLAVVFDRQPKYAWIMKQVRTLRYVHTLMYLYVSSVVLRCAVLYCTVLCCVVLYSIVLYCIEVLRVFAMIILSIPRLSVCLSACLPAYC